MQDIREIELRDSGSNANTKKCFEVRATALRPRLHKEWFSLCPHRTFHKGTSTEKLHLYTGSTQLFSQNTNLYRRGGHLAKYKTKKNTLGDHKDHKQSVLVILKDHK